MKAISTCISFAAILCLLVRVDAQQIQSLDPNETDTQVPFETDTTVRSETTNGTVLDVTIPDSIGQTFFNPILTIPLSEDPAVNTVGAGFTFGKEWFEPTILGNPMLSMDLVISGFQRDSRIFLTSDPMTEFEGKGVLNFLVRPGFRDRIQTQNGFIIADLGMVAGVKISGTREAGPAITAVPADSIEANAPAVGWYAGLGREFYDAFSNVKSSIMVQVQSVKTDFLTGRDRQETSLAVIVELPRFAASHRATDGIFGKSIWADQRRRNSFSSFLADVPVVGRLFQVREPARRNRILETRLTPRIMDQIPGN